jgi:mRNA interferase RelE/StbE
VARFEIRFLPSVFKDTRSIPGYDLKKVLERVDSLATNPRPPGSVKLSGKEYYRVRQGDYRIVYEILDDRLIIVVIKVGHRREVYK